MKKLVFSITMILILLFSGCADKRKEITVNSQAHNNAFTYVIDNTIIGSEANKIIFELPLSREEFFSELEKEDIFIEIYNDNTVLLYIEKPNNSSYFAFIYNGKSNNNFRYTCLSVEKMYNYHDLFISFDFPFYVLENNSNLTEGTYNLNCTFDYILSFYNRIDYVIDSQGEDFVVVNSYYYGEAQNEKIKIEKLPDNKIYITKV